MNYNEFLQVYTETVLQPSSSFQLQQPNPTPGSHRDVYIASSILTAYSLQQNWGPNAVGITLFLNIMNPFYLYPISNNPPAFLKLRTFINQDVLNTCKIYRLKDASVLEWSSGY